MKIFYFLLVILAIYFIMTRIDVVHINTLPHTQQSELQNRSKFRSHLLDNYVKSDSNANQIEHFAFKENEYLKNTELYSAKQFNSPDYKHDYFDLYTTPMTLPTANDLFILLRSEYIDSTYANNKYKFNITNLPTTNRYPNMDTTAEDKKYIKQIKHDIMSWNNLFPKYYHTNKRLIIIKSIKLIFIKETEFEFVVQAIVKLSYRNRLMHFQVEYYGQINRTDDILNGVGNTTTIKLVGLIPMSRSDFDIQPDSMYQEARSPFISMDEQLKYVNKINQMHLDEMNGI